MKPNFRALRLAFAAGALAPLSVLACSSCGCTLSSDWENQGISAEPGFRVDLRYDYINQNQLRHGSGKANAGDAMAAAGNGQVGELETYTRNHYYTLGLDYTFDRSWGIDVQIPYVDRAHGTKPFNGVDFDPEITSHSRSIGDVKVMGRYQGLSADGDTGLMFGAKLPTGRHDVAFGTGDPLDRSLQPGSGSTDVILGAYRFGSLNKNWDWFAQGLYQQAVATKDEYRPGNSFNMNLGLRYMGLDSAMPLLQINARTVRPDSGANADSQNTGGKIVYLSPGLTVPVTQSTRLYGFVQLPLYQHAVGFQLAPRWNASIGINVAL